MQYNHEKETITVKAYKVDVEIVFLNGKIIEVLLDGWNIEADADCLTGIFVDLGDLMGSEITPLSRILSDAQEAFQELYDEAEQQEVDELNMQKELSSPYLSGRI